MDGLLIDFFSFNKSFTHNFLVFDSVHLMQ